MYVTLKQPLLCCNTCFDVLVSYIRLHLLTIDHVSIICQISNPAD